MPISIKNEETEQLARKLAELTGESLTDAIGQSLSERYERLRRARSGLSLVDELNEIALRCAALPTISNWTDDQILGYDEMGLPTK
jgi:antitoxin VapB